VAPRLLVLDDDQNILALLRTYFGRLGWHVEACAEASAGLHLVDSDASFDAVICDLHFTGAHLGEGYEILTRARRRRPHSAVLLFTGAAGEGIREEALRRGADEVIAKPVPLAHLRDAALRAMKKP
jgi:CheY-like chemotaxis protein